MAKQVHITIIMLGSWGSVLQALHLNQPKNAQSWIHQLWDIWTFSWASHGNARDNDDFSQYLLHPIVVYMQSYKLYGPWSLHGMIGLDPETKTCYSAQSHPAPLEQLGFHQLSTPRRRTSHHHQVQRVLEHRQTTPSLQIPQDTNHASKHCRMINTAHPNETPSACSHCQTHNTTSEHTRENRTGQCVVTRRLQYEPATRHHLGEPARLNVSSANPARIYHKVWPHFTASPTVNEAFGLPQRRPSGAGGMVNVSPLNGFIKTIWQSRFFSPGSDRNNSHPSLE